MRIAFLVGLCLTLVAAPAHAGATLEDGPLSPCAADQADGGPTPQHAWGVEIASAFSKEEALAEFDRVKQDHSDILGHFAPIVVETCDLHMGRALRYSARIGLDSRDDADALCAELQQAGGACIVIKN